MSSHVFYWDTVYVVNTSCLAFLEISNSTFNIFNRQQCINTYITSVMQMHFTELTNLIYVAVETMFLHLYLLFYCQFLSQDKWGEVVNSRIVTEPTLLYFHFYLCRRWNLITNWYQSWPLGSRNVTILTIQGHVTSSVTWPFASQWAISYFILGPLDPSLYL